MGVTTAILFFLSVLLHELAHSLLTKAQGIFVESITLIVSEEAHVWGIFSHEKNSIELEEDQRLENQDLLNLAAIKTLINGGNVLVLSSEKLPGNSPAVAILHY
jgi:Zn-dependent protease